MCACRPQYTGSTCQKRIESVITDAILDPAKQIYQTNPCSTNPCNSGSTCVNVNVPNVNPPYACVCPTGFTGSTCNQPLNNQPQYNQSPCSNNQCVQPTPVTYQPPTPQPYQPPAQNPCQSNQCNQPQPCQNCQPPVII